MKLNVRFLHSRAWLVAVRPAAPLHGILSNAALCGGPTRRVWAPKDGSVVLRTFPDVRPSDKRPEGVYPDSMLNEQSA
jgi:hypothetical protein